MSETDRHRGTARDCRRGGWFKFAAGAALVMAGGWWLQTRASAQSLDAAGAAGPALGWSAWVLFALLLAGSGLISASETALFSLDKLDLLRLRGSTRWTDRSILMLLLRPNDTLITILILNNLINITASLTAGALMEDVLGGAGALAFGGAALLATTGILVVGEILPKTVGHLHPQRAARLLAPGLAATDWVLTPVRRTLGIFLKALLRFLRLPMVAAGDEVTEEELKVMIKSGEFSSVLEQDEREMIDGVFDLRQTIVAEIFNPRMAMVALPDDLTQQEMIARLRESPHNRVPIYHENLDHLMGFILTKEVLLDERGLWRDHLREALCVPERIGLLDLLKTFRKQRTKIAIVVDEYGGVAGMVTLQDLLEEIVGDIYEKHEPRQQEIAALEGDNWRVAGSMPLEEAGERLGVRFPEHKGRTIGGFVMNTLGRVPSPGDTVEFENLSLKVEKMATRRVQTLLVTAPAPVAGPTAAPTPDAGDGRPG